MRELIGGVGFLGSGVMAEAMLSRLLEAGLCPPQAVVCSDPSALRLEALQRTYGVRVTQENLEAATSSRVVVLSVKPQVLEGVLAQLRGRLAPDQLVVSVAAGVPLRVLTEGLGHQALVRVMPNTPARIGQGVSVWMATAAVAEEQGADVRALLQALGRELRVTREEELDMATALSGTGPAYVFLFMEALIDAGVHLGFSRAVAQELVLQTVRGSAEFASVHRAHLAELRNQVTSPGGTSAEAIYQLEKGGLRTILSKAVWAAFNRSTALSVSVPHVPLSPHGPPQPQEPER